MRKRAFTLVELLLVVSILGILLGSLTAVQQQTTEERLITRDMAALEQWLNAMMARADRWRSDFALSIVMPLSSTSRHYASVKWLGGNLAPQKTEYFYAASGVKWRLSGSVHMMFYQWSTHSISPAFVIQALRKDGKLSGDSLTVSLRGQITRQRSGKIY